MSSIDTTSGEWVIRTNVDWRDYGHTMNVIATGDDPGTARRRAEESFARWVAERGNPRNWVENVVLEFVATGSHRAHRIAVSGCINGTRCKEARA